jgi:hypothetical protein
MAACAVTEHLLVAVGPLLQPEHRRALYPELLKRLDDSSNPVDKGVDGGVRGVDLGVEGCGCSAGGAAVFVVSLPRHAMPRHTNPPAPHASLGPTLGRRIVNPDGPKP